MRRARTSTAERVITALTALAYAVVVVCILTDGFVADVVALVLVGGAGLYVRHLRTRIGGLLVAAEDLRARQIERSDRISSYERARRTDAVTGLGNRDHLDAALPRLVAEAGTSLSSLAVLVLELEGVARYRDRHGAEEGDRALKALAAQWQAHMRINDVLARVAAAEFVAVLPACSPPNAHRVAHRLAATVPGELTCSVGVASWDGSEGYEQLLARAELATRTAGVAEESLLVAD